jgi:hypothetical protein
MRMVVNDHERIFLVRPIDDPPLRPASIDRSFAVMTFDHSLNLMLG